MNATVGQRLPDLASAPITPKQLVMYAGASGDFNPIHYDADFAKAGGFPSVIAHGMLSMAFFGRLLTQWCGAERVRRISSRFKAVTLPGDVITCTGEVTELDEKSRSCVIKLIAKKQDGTVTLEGSATVSLA
jgi:acyl dehydratase